MSIKTSGHYSRLGNCRLTYLLYSGVQTLHVETGPLRVRHVHPPIIGVLIRIEALSTPSIPSAPFNTMDASIFVARYLTKERVRLLELFRKDRLTFQHDSILAGSVRKSRKRHSLRRLPMTHRLATALTMTH